MIVKGETALKTTFTKANFLASLHSENGKVFGKISSNDIGSLEDFETSLGFTAQQLQDRLQSELDDVIQTANAELAAGLVIPKILGIDVSDVEINFFDGYLALGLTASQTFWSQVGGRMSVMKQHLLAMKPFGKDTATCKAQHAGEDECNSDGECVWCYQKCASTGCNGSAQCWSIEDAKQLPPGVFLCDAFKGFVPVALVQF